MKRKPVIYIVAQEYPSSPYRKGSIIKLSQFDRYSKKFYGKIRCGLTIYEWELDKWPDFFLKIPPDSTFGENLNKEELRREIDKLIHRNFCEIADRNIP